MFPCFPSSTRGDRNLDLMLLHCIRAEVHDADLCQLESLLYSLLREGVRLTSIFWDFYNLFVCFRGKGKKRIPTKFTKIKVSWHMTYVSMSSPVCLPTC